MGLGRTKAGWLAVLGSTIALTFSNGPVLLFTFGVFLRPVSEEYGWQRGTMSLAVTAGLVVSGLVTPFAGMLIDRWNIQRVTLGFITLFAASFALISLTPPSVAAFIALYAVAGMFSCGHAPLPYAKAISGWFEDNRGLGLGIAMAGVGVGIAVVPQLAQVLLRSVGWREAYALLGAATWLVAFPAVLFLVKDPQDRRADRLLSANAKLGEAVVSVTRERDFWLIAIAASLVVTAVNGVVAHLVALVMDHGVPAATAAPLLAAVGLATIAGRLVSGYLLDRTFAPYLAAAIFLVPLLGIALLLSGVTAPGLLDLVAICLGLGLGAEVDIIGFLVGRYFGLRHYGQVYGYIFAAFTVASGVGPFLMGYSYDQTGSYAPCLIAFGAALLAASVLIALLGAYRFPAHSVAAGLTIDGVQPPLDQAAAQRADATRGEPSRAR